MAKLVSGMNPTSFPSGDVFVKGNLFLPPKFNAKNRYPGVVVGGTWTSVKEQMSNRYASRLAEQGFVTLDYDFRNYGESEGEPRQLESAVSKIADNRAAIDYLLSLPFVDPARVGVLGICASASYMSGTVAKDKRVKSLALVAPWLHNPEIIRMVYGGEEGVKHRIDLANAARKKYQKTGEVDYVPAYDPTNPEAAMFFELDFYGNPKRGCLPQWTNRFAVMGWKEWLEFDGVSLGAKIKVPTFIIHSQDAAVPMGAQAYYDSLTVPKDIYWTQGIQTDFYDQEPQVSKSVEAVGDHFRRTL